MEKFSRKKSCEGKGQGDRTDTDRKKASSEMAEVNSPVSIHPFFKNMDQTLAEVRNCLIGFKTNSKKKIRSSVVSHIKNIHPRCKDMQCLKVNNENIYIYTQTEATA